MNHNTSNGIITVTGLHEAIVGGELGGDPRKLFTTGASYIYQTTQFPGSETKYYNYYLLLRVESYFGACSHSLDQLSIDIAEELSGTPLSFCIQDARLPVRVAAMDAYLGTVFPHAEHCSKIIDLPAGTPVERANFRDNYIADAANIAPGMKIALIGVVNPLIAAIKQHGGTCLPCDLQMEKTQWGDPVEKDMEKVLDVADGVICTGMTLSNGTFDRIVERTTQRNIPLTVYAQTGSAIAARFVDNGITALVAEPFPFSQFSAGSTRLYYYGKGGEL